MNVLIHTDKTTEKVLNPIVKTGVAALCQTIGWHAAQTSAIDVLSDIFKHQLMKMGRLSHSYAQHYGRTNVNLDDISLAFKDMGSNLAELEDYAQNFDPVPLPFPKKFPNFPKRKESHLNFLRPGSEEVLTRPVHVHEYMPPMILEAPKDLHPKPKEKPVIVEPKVENGENVGTEERNNFNSNLESLPSNTVNGTSEADEKSQNQSAPNVVQPEIKVEEESSEDEIEELKTSPSKTFSPFSKMSKNKGRYVPRSPKNQFSVVIELLHCILILT